MCLAIPGKLLTKTNIGGVEIGLVQFGGIKREICLQFVPEADLGDYVLVHVGYAISRLDEAEARRTYELLQQMGVLEKELLPAGQPSKTNALPLA